MTMLAGMPLLARPTETIEEVIDRVDSYLTSLEDVDLQGEPC